MIEVMNQGGPMMWVILGLSVVATMISMERVAVLYVLSFLNVSKLVDRVIALVEAREYGQALEACNLRTGHPLPRVLRAGLAKANRRDREIEKAMEAEMLRALPGLQRGIDFLGLLGNVATLLGLLGTIFGLIQAFSAVSAASAADRQTALASGISIAMYTTAFGIIAAVPILFAHTVLSARMDKLLIQLEEGATALMGVLSNRDRRSDAA